MPGFLRLSYPDFFEKSGQSLQVHPKKSGFPISHPDSRRRPSTGLPAFMNRSHAGVPPWTAPLHGVPSHRRPPAGLPAFIVCHHVRRPAIGLPAFIKLTHAGVPRLDCPPSSSRVTQASHHRTARLHRIAARRASRQWTARPRPLISRKRPCIGQPAFVVSIASVSNWHYRPQRNNFFSFKKPSPRSARAVVF